MQLYFEIEGPQERALEIPGGGSEFVAFMSFANSRGFGAQHPYIALADRLHDAFGVSLGPLTTFYEAGAEDSEDEEKLELAWQRPAELLESVSRMAAALDSDAQCKALAVRANAAALGAQAAVLRPALEQAAELGRRVRLSYSL